MKFSIIVPVYNTERYIMNCYKSIVADGFSDLEIIFINDGSTDNSLDILQSIAKFDNRVKVISQENQGVSVARNRGLKAATGDYISFIDSDDEYQGDIFQNLNSMLLSDPVDLVIFQMTHKKMSNLKINHLERFNKREFDDNFSDEFKCCLEKIYMDFNFFSSCTKIIKRDIIENNKVEFPKYHKIGEDAIFSFQIYDIARTYLLLDADYYYYRIRNGSAMDTPKNQERLLDELIMFHQLDSFFKKWNMNSLIAIKDGIHMTYLAKDSLKNSELIPGLSSQIRYFFDKNNFKRLNIQGKIKFLIICYVMKKYHHINIFK